MKKIIVAVLLAASFISCVENPNVTEDTYTGTPNAMRSWLVGVKRQMALTMNSVLINTEITSDNYFNNYSQYSKVFDRLQIDYFDVDVNSLQADVLALREMAEYGISKVAPTDKATTDKDVAYLYFCRAYANLLGGELFVGLPESKLGKAISSKELIQRSLLDLDKAISIEADVKQVTLYKLLKARAYYNLGNTEEAKKMALEVMNTKNFLYQIVFDGRNGVPNEMQNAIFDALPNRLAPLPRLDFLDPKYYSIGTIATDQKPISIGKSEEAFLIMAEIQLSENTISAAKATLKTLVTDVIKARPTVSISDKNENRNGGNRKDYPLKAVGVKFDEQSDVRSGLVLDRQAGNVVAYTVSGTSVDLAQIDRANTIDDVLYLVYLIRQEVFLSEGRRLSDLGIKFPISQIEKDNNPNIGTEYIKAQIPSFIPAQGAYDDFTTDKKQKLLLNLFSLLLPKLWEL